MLWWSLHKIKTTTTMSEQKMRHILVNAINASYGTNFDVDDENLIYDIGETKYKTVFFPKLRFEHPASKLCMLTKHRSKKHTGRSGRSFVVSIHSGEVVCRCFSSKCKERNQGRFVLAQACEEADTSDEDTETEEEEEDDNEHVDTTGADAEPPTKRLRV
jgi:hypothetical protein